MISELLHILFGAAFTVAVCVAAGALLLRRLRIALEDGEEHLFRFLAGSACVSLAVFLLAVLHQARKGVFLWAGCAVIAAAVAFARRGSAAGRFPELPRRWKAFFWTVFAAFFLVYFFHALAPETSPDGSGYHLGDVLRTWQARGFRWDYHSLYAAMPKGIEMLFLVAYSFGGFSSAALVHLAFQTALPLLIVCYGRRFGCPRAAVFAAIAVYASPVVGITGASAYNDLAVATLGYAGFFLLQVWNENKESKWLLLLGILCGFAVAVKYTAAVIPLYVAIFVAWRGQTASKRLQGIAVIALSSSICILPWILRDWFWLGNPAAPFLNSWFPNPWIYPGTERLYLQGLRYYPKVNHWWNIPLEVIVRGGLVPGMLGPVFLLTPMALLPWRQKRGQGLLLASLVFSVPSLLNTETRFWIPVLPFVALGIGLALAKWPRVLAAVAVAHALLCWPGILTLYAHPYAWCIRDIPVRAALRLTPEQDYIVARIPEYALGPVLEREVPVGGKVFSFAGRPEAYLNRDIIVGYESAPGTLAGDILMTPLEHGPSTVRRFRFTPVAARGVRVVETARADVFWSVAELRAFLAGRELPRVPAWRLSAKPNPWDVQLAFDNSYATRWRTWQAMRPGDRIEIDFGRLEELDQVAIESTYINESKLKVEVMAADGSWSPAAAEATDERLAPPTGLRRAATAELLVRGIGWLLINDTDSVAADLVRHPEYWGVTEIGRAGIVRVYRINPGAH
jgi:hypothetical protein